MLYQPAVFGSGAALAPAGGGAAVTWNPADKSTLVVLSGSDLIATIDGGLTDVNGLVRATTSKSTGKWYFRVVITALPAGAVGGDDLSIGLVTVARSVNAQLFGAGAVAGGVQMNVSGVGTLYINNFSYQADGETYVNGGIVDIAYDGDNNRFWVRENGAGNWNHSGTANPATNTEGIAVTAATYFPVVSGSYGPVVTARFANDASGTAPSGFSWWG